ncbi:Tannase/feruloyl esterase [Truncatella angustata]|uniref:Carboxylic ester hydrolase n=1 Tax=Truncatella angustata TaxID=152316 RepID=A0A9P9A3I5_9PEZI|nr:Tannase/feruloyl esterase [Truncatella angustata]KAH6658969.1 Tannase/feruloyl esterase [Truncatella angustata]KAH8203223.1 hypothetical protein TruAng_002628 [Truncatella angustata]
MCAALVAASACASATFTYPSLLGAEFLSITANLVQNLTREVSDQLYYNHPSISLKGVKYCNVTVTYTHPGQNDTINVENWLPMDTWNKRLMAVGGGGYIAGRFALSYAAMAGAIGEGYAATSSDAGLPANAYSPDEWAQVSPGNPNLYLLQDVASVALNDQAVISKSVINDFYGQPPSFSYWSGCSQGGRQGMTLAQRYPDAYDGIAAAAPAFNWAQFIPAAAWAQVMMDLLDTFPFPCELNAITDAAVAACDALDGITDGLVSDAASCNFDPFSVVGQPINCTDAGAVMNISKGAATIANLTWTGPRSSDGEFLWYGPYSQARLTGAAEASGTTSDLGYAMTSCTNGTCYGVPTGLGESWLKYWVEKDPNWNYTAITSADEFAKLFHESVRQFDSVIGTSDADLRAFQAEGGKMITYHGLADGLIPTGGTVDYYDRVLKVTPNAQDYFRFFEVPGLAHCSGGSGGQPTATFQALVDWVENGIVPETLPISFNDTAGVLNTRILCPYPEKVQLKSNCTTTTSPECFECA